jgi:hypothetical protein
MFGLIVILIALGYLLLSVAVVIAMRKHARNTGKNVRRWSWGAALVMWLIPFWDWLPTVAVHQYHCATEAGFWVYKTPEQWKLENPGVMETLVGHEQSPTKHVGDDDSYTVTYFLNDRFNWLVNRDGKLLFNRWRHEEEVVDVKNNEVLARYVDFSTSQERPRAGWSGWKFWLGNEHCSGGRHNEDEMGRYEFQFKGVVK